MNNNLEEAVKPIDFVDGKLLILDQKELPFNEIYLEITEPYGLIKAIKELSIRGAPLLGLAGIYGLYFSSLNCNDFSDLENYSLKIRNARPTAVNLFWAINRMLSLPEKVFELFLEEAKNIEREDEEMNLDIATLGSSLIPFNRTA